MINPVSKVRLGSLLPYLALTLAIGPSLIWVMLDQRVWPWDQAWYGQVSVELFYKLISSPLDWVGAMLGAFGTKAPGVSWLGQFFVPFGVAIGSIDRGLLLSILATQLLTLILIFKSVKELSGGKNLTAIVASLVVASAPLFVAMSHQYFVEPMQTCAVAWFILIMSFAPRWDRKLILVQLVAATALAMLAKVTSPLYCLFAGLLSLICAYAPQLRRSEARKLESPKWLAPSTLVLGGFLGCGTIAWYIKNFSAIAQFAAQSSSGAVAELYGTKDTFLNKVIYWLGAIQSNFFFPGVIVLAGLIFIVGLWQYFFKLDSKLSHFDRCAVVSIMHIGITIGVLSLSINQENRYLLPLAPYFALLIAWSLNQINQPMITSVTILVFTLQLAGVGGQALGILDTNPQIAYWLYPVERDAKNFTNLNEVARRTCAEAGKNRQNVVGIELPWLNANSVAYFAAKQFESRNLRCYYTSLGYAETEATKAWQRLLSLEPNYFITLDKTLYPNPPDPFNKVALQMLDKVQRYPAFKLESTIDNSKILLFKNKG